MPINTKHGSYERDVAKTTKVRDFYKGSDQVKSKGDVYLPKLQGQSVDEYNAYKTRGYLIPSVKATAQAMKGAINRRPAEVETVPESIVNNFTGEGCGINNAASCIISELLLAGGVGYLVEWDNNLNAIKAVEYKRESIINYSNDYIVLSQSYTEQNPKDKFEQESKLEYLELTYDENGVYIQNIWREKHAGFEIVDTLYPTRRGDLITEIPFVFCAVDDVKMGFGVSNPILLDLANANQDQYLLSTDQRHGLHWTALPTLFLFGELSDAEGKRKKIKVGAGSSNHIEDTDARAELIEFTGAGLGALKAAIDSAIDTMASIGAKMLTSTSGGVKAAETARIDASAETATLNVIADKVDECINKILLIMQGWTGVSMGEYSINKDFIDTKLNPNELMTLLRTWQSGGMSLDSFLYNLERGELLPKNITREEEAERIEDGQAFSDFSEPETIDG